MGENHVSVTAASVNIAGNNYPLVSSTSPTSLTSLADAILQAARIKFTKTEYISCPGCGRTLYNLQETIARIKAATKDLVGLKIGIMGCIVNGPGEARHADIGIAGGALSGAPMQGFR